MERQGTFWHSEAPDCAASCSWGNGLPRISTRGMLRHLQSGTSFLIMNTHLHWDEASLTNAITLLQDKIVESSEGRSVLLLDDFHTGPQSEAHARLTPRWPFSSELSFKDVFTLADLEDSTGTYHVFSGKSVSERVDWILVCPHFHSLLAKIVDYNKDGGIRATIFRLWLK